MLTLFAAFWLFFSGVNYTRWQFNTGVRYMAPMFPFLFLLTTVVLVRLPRYVLYSIAVLSVTQAWCMAMYRDIAAGQVELNEVKEGLGVLDPVLHVFTEGLQLPALTTLYRMGGPLVNYFSVRASTMSLLVLAAVILWVVWLPRQKSELS